MPMSKTFIGGALAPCVEEFESDAPAAEEKLEVVGVSHAAATLIQLGLIMVFRNILLTSGLIKSSQGKLPLTNGVNRTSVTQNDISEQ